MNTNRFKIFLQSLGFLEIASEKLKEDTFTYTIDAGQNKFEVNYVYTPTNEGIFQTHLKYWNINNVNFFIAVGDHETHIINAKEKPDRILSEKIKIHSFDYGVNSEGFEKEKIREISKEYIDASYFFDFVIKNKKSKHEVDKDLLLNLIALRNDLLTGKNEDIVHLMILRCLFLKYLEDNGIYDRDYLVNILKTHDPQKLIKAFDEITKINGDIFKFDRFTGNEIEPAYLEKLFQFFSSDYLTKQLHLFPYQFNRIPIQLISHVYEAFLKSEEKKGKGIYYTPSFVVNFMLPHILSEKLEEKKEVTILDPAVGSGAFLVESFRMILKSYKGNIDYYKKKEILQNQLFGIDIDRHALQIATFSLYLALIETENPEFIRQQIENSYPILPSLIGKNLIEANALTDNVFENKTFDCIVSNPPWGSVERTDDPENQKERKAIEAKGKIGTIPEYKNVSDYERSQAFLLRVKKWSNQDTVFSMIVKNSMFLNDNASDFRKDILDTYQFNYFYELSNYNEILFKKRVIGKINKKDIEIGATEPCAILIFEPTKQQKHVVKYISPKLNDFSKNFECIHFTQKDINEIEQNHFLTDDLLWRVLVDGSWEDYQLIKKLLNFSPKAELICSRGFEPEKIDVQNKKSKPRNLIKSNDFERYFIKNSLIVFDWDLQRRREGNEALFNEGERILVAYRPTSHDKLRLRGIWVKEDMVFRDDIIGLKIATGKQQLPFLPIINSSLIGYFLFFISSHWFGGLKRDSIRLTDLKKIPLSHPESNEYKIKNRQLSKLAETIQFARRSNRDVSKYEKQVDELVFDLYNLLDYEKEIIREFYQVRVERTGKRKNVDQSDLNSYIKNFTDTFELMLADSYTLKATYNISENVGAVVCFTIIDQHEIADPYEDNSLEILHFVKNKQLQQAEISKILNEDKVKIYDEKFFYIIKSNLFKDWTKRQAIKDAKEEIGMILTHLPKRNG